MFFCLIVCQAQGSQMGLLRCLEVAAPVVGVGVLEMPTSQS